MSIKIRATLIASSLFSIYPFEEAKLMQLELDTIVITFTLV